MLRHIWVTPKQFCELTNATPEKASAFSADHGFITTERDGQIYIDLMDFCFGYRLAAMMESLPLNFGEAVPKEAFKQVQICN